MGDLEKCPVTGKVCHPTKAAADVVMKEVAWKRKAYDLQTYTCPHCKKWHFGHSKDKLAKRIRYVLGSAKRERKS